MATHAEGYGGCVRTASNPAGGTVATTCPLRCNTASNVTLSDRGGPQSNPVSAAGQRTRQRPSDREWPAQVHTASSGLSRAKPSLTGYPPLPASPHPFLLGGCTGPHSWQQKDKSWPLATRGCRESLGKVLQGVRSRLCVCWPGRRSVCPLP